MSMRPRVVIAGANSGSGKTTVTMGLIAAIRARGTAAQPFKAGPDLIDPGYHTAAAGQPCRNLDTMLLPGDRLLELFDRSAPEGGVSVIEGVMGLFDGAGARDERGSTAHLAKTLASPVILTVNGKAMGRSAAALVAGFSGFDPETQVKGVIFNNISGERHYLLLKEAVEDHTGIPVLGWLPARDDIALPERRMGLVPAAINPQARALAETLGRMAEESMDIGGVLSIARSAPPLPSFLPSVFTAPGAGSAVIAAARDEAFSLCWRDNLDILEHLGAEIEYFSPLEDSALPPDAEGVYIGGDFPEEFAPALAENAPLKHALRESAAGGMPVLAGAGGLKYLAGQLEDREGRLHAMAGVLPGATRAVKKAVLGYFSGRLDRPVLPGEEGKELAGRLFHYSSYDPGRDAHVLSMTLNRDGVLLRDGPALNNVFASFLGLHFGTDLSPAVRLIRAAVRYRQKS